MERRGSEKRLYFGIILIVLGVILLSYQLGMLSEKLVNFLTQWPMLFVGVGTISLIGGNRKGGIILIIIGVFFLICKDNWAVYWPLILIAVGITILFRQRDPHKFRIGTAPEENISEANSTNSYNSVNTFDDFVIFGGREIFINSQALAGGKATSIFGGIEFDMKKANLQPGGAVVDCISVFGGCGFKIPMDWIVRNEVTTIFGAFTDKRGDTYSEKYYDPSKTIVIKGVSIFGGIEVKHF